MKFLLEFVTCCTACPAEPLPPPLPPEATKFLVLQTQEPRRRIPRKHWRLRDAARREWRPSLTSISEDVLTTVEKKVNNVDRPVRRRRRWSLIKKKIASISQRDRSRSLDHENCRSSTPLSTLMLSPTPFMF